MTSEEDLQEMAWQASENVQLEFFEEAETVSSLNDIEEKLDKNILPNDVFMIRIGEELSFYSLERSKSGGIIVKFSIIISSSMMVEVFRRGLEYPQRKYQ